MLFQILDYLPELEKYGKVIEKSSWIQATCPICKGKLKISKNPSKYGAYACYTDNCHTNNKIRNFLYKKRPFPCRMGGELDQEEGSCMSDR